MKNKGFQAYMEVISVFIMVIGMLLLYEKADLFQNLCGGVNVILGIITYIYWRAIA